MLTRESEEVRLCVQIGRRVERNRVCQTARVIDQDARGPVAGPVVVAYPHERDIAEWQQRHAAGEVPGQLPYGLHALASRGRTLRVEQVAMPGRAARWLTRVPQSIADRALGGSSDAPPNGVLLTWDESAAVRVAGRRRQRMAHHSGVIWLTDRPEGRAAAAAGRVLRGCAGLWTLSSAQVEPLGHLLGRGGPTIAAVVFGIDTDFFTPTPYPDRPLVVSVGGDRDRDPETLFAALEHVQRARPEVEIVVQSRTDATAPPGVTVVPHLTHVQLRELYRRMTVMVLATRPNLHVSGMTVSLEARATGRPVVITGSPGMEDYVDEDDSVVVPTANAPALGEAVIDLLDDPDRAAAMGRAGRLRVEQSHTESSMCAQILSLIER